MPKATFTKDFVWKPKRNVRLVYKAGKTYGITTACHAKAMQAGAIALAAGGYVKPGPLPLMGEDARR